jgi:tRNA pseudouridine32 synthase/23S rRNA pseudouridine746 synthase/23S rRNA pseudouridine1911/1915/1917 synthase
MMKSWKIPARYQPKGFKIIYEDADLIVGEKSPGILTVAAAWERVNTVHHALNLYVRKGNSRSRKSVFVVHRLDQATSGLLIFAKSEAVCQKLKSEWKNVRKTYFTVVHGRLNVLSGEISSFLQEDEDYMVHVTDQDDKAKFAITRYTVVASAHLFSLLKIDLVTGRKNQIRVHMASEGHPVVGDGKYGPAQKKHSRLALHSQALAFNHPVTGEPMLFDSAVPAYFYQLVPANLLP